MDLAVACFVAAGGVFVGLEFVLTGSDLFSSLAGVELSLAGTVALSASGAAGDGVWFASDMGAAELLLGADVVAAPVNGAWGSGALIGAVRWVETK